MIHLTSLNPVLPPAVLDAITDFEGSGALLGSALGALMMGQLFGLCVLRLLHTKATLRRYQNILGIEFKSFCPNTTSLGLQRSAGLAVAMHRDSYWSIIQGQYKVVEKSLLTNQDVIFDILQKYQKSQKYYEK